MLQSKDINKLAEKKNGIVEKGKHKIQIYCNLAHEARK